MKHLAVLCALLAGPPGNLPADEKDRACVLEVRPDPKRAVVPFLSWDTEGGDRARTNLLRPQPGLTLRALAGGKWLESPDLKAAVERSDREGLTAYTIAIAPSCEVLWTMRSGGGRLESKISVQGAGKSAVERLEIIFPFDPRATPTTVLPREWGEDGTDTFGKYMNGGITAGQVLHFLAAHYVVGEGEEADRILRAMLERQARGGFQNGVTDAGDQGIDWTTWDGKPCGYEGYLADSFRFLQAVLLREPALRERYYRPRSEGR